LKNQKNIFILTILLFSIIITSNAQINWGIKGGLNYNKFGVSEFVTIGGVSKIEAKGRTGFHIGVFAKVKIPVLGIYLRPELVYTEINSDFNEAEFNLNKIDIPILIGINIIGPLHAFIGPSFQFTVDSGFGASLFAADIKTDDFSIGVQMGFGIELGKFGVDVRWERGLSNTEYNLIPFVSDSGAIIDTRPNQLILSLSVAL